MESVITGLLVTGEQGLSNALGSESLLASNHDGIVDGELRDRDGSGDVINAQAAQELLAASADAAVAAGAVVPVELPKCALAVVSDGAEEEDERGHEHDHEHVDGICEGLLSEDAWLTLRAGAQQGLVSNGDVLVSAPLMALDKTFRLHSNPGASKTIYLDFTGHTTTGTAWNSWNNGAMGSSFYSPAFNNDGNVSLLGDNELILIQWAWQRVAADFAAFDVNVTTQEPLQDWLSKSGSADQSYGIRAVVTNYGPTSASSGGIAYVDSFNWNSDTPVFVYNTSLIGVSEAISHEVGHALGLSHDGVFDAATNAAAVYYAGHGSGETGWAPIMGASYYQNVTTWDDGTYYNSNNGGAGANYGKGSDDLAVITGYNGFSYQLDREGDGLVDASSLVIKAGVVSQFGAIETASDVDVFRFDLIDSGGIDLRIDPYVYRAFVDSDGLWGGEAPAYYASVGESDGRTSYVDHGANLDLSVRLLNATGSVVLIADSMRLGTSVWLNGLPAGTYYLSLEGVGIGDPTTSAPSGYSDYGSLGNYLITGTVTGAAAPVVAPVITLTLSPSSVQEDGSESLVYTFTRSVVTSDALGVNFTLGGSAISGFDYTGLLPGTSLITFAPNASTATLVLDPVADTGVESDDTVSITLASGLGYTVGTSGAVVGTIRNDDVVSETPVITLSLTPGSVTEDGASNLVYTFSRSVVTGSSLSVNVTVGGTATNGSDYTGLLAGSAQTVTFAANAATATLVVNPTADSTVEGDETVSLQLAAGSGYSVGTVDAVTGVIVNDDPKPLALAFTPGVDTLTGSTAADTFQLARLSDALWSSTPDRITNLQVGTDAIDSATSSSSLRVRQLGAVSSLDAAGIGRVLTSKAFGRGTAATFTFNDIGGMRTFLAVNDMTAGFNASSDSVLEITGFSGSLSSLTVI